MKRLLLTLILLTLSLSVSLAQIAPAPPLMNFSGRLTKPDGTPVANGNYSIRFSLWTAQSGGTEKWNQTINPMTVRNGTFTVLLNTSTGAADKFNGNLWLEVKIGSEAPLTPRQQLVSVAYAQKANSVPDGSIGTAQIANGAVTASKIDSSVFTSANLWSLLGNSGTNPATQFLGTKDNQPIVFRANNIERMRLLPNGNFGIGTNNPIVHKLEVVGTNALGILYRREGERDARISVADTTRTWSVASGWATAGDFSIIEEGVSGNRLYIQKGTGNVGIGNSNPIWKMDVTGTTHVGIRYLRTDAKDARITVGDPTRQWSVASGWATAGDFSIIEEFVDGYRFYIQKGTGNVGIGTGNPAARLDVNGTARAQVMEITGGSDVAEPYHVAPVGDVKPLPGMVVCIDPQNPGQMKVAAKAYDKTVGGILSGANGIQPGITLRQEGTVADGTLPVASVGRVYCWCDADANGAIEAGDLLTTSDTPGHAMKVTDFSRSNGTVIGKAMSSLKSGKGLVLVLVSLK